MNNLFLTGEVGVGKSTILKNALEKINLSIGGYITERSIKDNTKSFTIRSLYDGVKTHPIAKSNVEDYSKEIFIDTFEVELPTILDNSLKKRDVIVLDELGFMENDIEKFTSKVYELLDSEKPIFGVLKDYECEFLNNIRNRKDATILEITKENRDFILEEVLDVLNSFGVKMKRKNSFMWNKSRIDLYNKALDHPESDYPNIFIEEIKKYTGDLNNKTILDIGAGTGAFSIPLMKEGAYITAIDSSFNMLSSLYNRAKKNNVNNFNLIIGPFERIEPNKHNIAISAFSGNSTKSPEGIKKMSESVKDYAFIISSFENHENNFHRDILFKRLNRVPKRKKSYDNSIANMLKTLDNNGYLYSYKKIKYEFSQYFDSFEDALDFFIDRYNIKTPKETRITKEFLDDFLIKKRNQYKFENIKESWLIAIKSKLI